MFFSRISPLLPLLIPFFILDATAPLSTMTAVTTVLLGAAQAPAGVVVAADAVVELTVGLALSVLGLALIAAALALPMPPLVHGLAGAAPSSCRRPRPSTRAPLLFFPRRCVGLQMSSRPTRAFLLLRRWVCLMVERIPALLVLLALVGLMIVECPRISWRDSITVF
ncbi:unnamed protein product [Prorocentrum cordatum]|uniref:Uncharacterized protein n=1 Tax=Prorocentrum cordatum TaxID=2364126 RepID=A0ABN9S0X6_9DINO|nr:unnamed protein product [Polarella glacialis]